MRLFRKNILLFLLCFSLLLCLPTPSLAAETVDFKELFGNNSVYRSLEYLGLEFDKHGQPKVNGIPYISPGSRGNETVTDPSTPTGLAPDVKAFRSRGFVCAGFVNYYLTNYLTNIEGKDMTAFKEEMVAHHKVSGHSYQAVVFWAKLLEKQAFSGSGLVSRLYVHSANADNSKVPMSVCETMLPGDIIVIGRQDTQHSHIAIFLGSQEGNYYIAHQPGPVGPQIDSLSRYLEDGGYMKTHVTGIYRIATASNESSYVENNEQTGIVIDVSTIPPAPQNKPHRIYIKPVCYDRRIDSIYCFHCVY